MTRFLITSLLVFAACTQVHGVDAYGNRDVLYGPEGDVVAVGFVAQETREGVEYASALGLPTKLLRWSQVDRIEYAGMADKSFYAVGMSDMSAGQFETAAQRFAAMAMGEDKKEWEKAYGWFYEGVAWERAKAFDKAAAAFGNVASNFPKHRLAFDAFYRQGINQARSKDSAGAKATAAALEAIGEEERNRQAKNRAQAITVAVAASEGKMEDATSLARRVTFSARDGLTNLHWNQYWAGVLMERGEYAEAVSVYERLLATSGDVDPAETAALSLGHGIALAKDGKPDRALSALMRLDALPYGSPEQRLEARFWIGKLMWELAQERRNHEREVVAEFATASITESRRLLEAVVASTLSNPVKEEAKLLLESIPAPDQAAAE